jgi:outer membrane protein insertion porin family
LIPKPIFAEDIVRTVILMPFEIHSKENAANLQNAIYEGLAGRLGKATNIILVEREQFSKILEGRHIDDSLAQAVGKKMDANYVIMGSLTEFGESISANVRILDVKKETFLPAVFAQGRGPEGISTLSAKLSIDILIRVGAEQRIARIEFKGNRRIESSAISQVLISVSGSVFSEAILAQDIKAIYKMGYFNDVTIQATDISEGKIVTFVVQEKEIISSVKIQGNKAISKDDVEAAITVKAKQPLNLEKIKADVIKIKDLYDSKGYYNAEIVDIVEKDGDKDARVIFKIVENKRLYIRSITFSGNQAYTEKELRKMMNTKKKGFFYFFSDSGILKKEQLKQDMEKINAFYLNHGFIYAQVGEPEISHDKEGIRIKILITEGKQYRVGKVGITGEDLKTPRSELLAKLTIIKKKYYDREAVVKDMDYLQQVCSDEGFAYGDVIPRTYPQDKNQTVDVMYQIVKGNQVYFNRINITGNNKTRDKVIRRLLSVVEGDLYNKSNLKKSYMALNRLRYFEEVDFQTEKGPNEGLTDVNIRVKEKATGMFSIGAGYSAYDKAILTAQISQQNLFGRGQILSLKANLSANSRNYDLSFTEPWLFDIPLWSKFDIWNMYREYDTYDLDSKGGGFTFGYPIWEYVTGYAGYRLSREKVYNISTAASSYIKKQEGELTTSSTTITLSRDTTDDYIFPSIGSRSSASMEYAGGFLQGGADFTKYNISAAKFFSLPFDNVFGIRGRAGYLTGFGGKDVPVYERFYLGGINSLRGLRSVGPVDPATGDVIGGLTMLNFNAELVFPLIKNAGMKGVLFYDTGNAWESGYHISDMRKTAGLGVRWYSPIGPLRLEWGYVIDRKGTEPTSRWEFTIGMFM